MKILYYGLVDNEEFFKKKIKRKTMPYIVAQHMFEMAMIEEIEKNENIQIECNHIEQEEYAFRKSKLYIKNKIKKLTKKLDIKDIPYINIPVIKFITLFISSFIRSFKWCFKNRRKKEKVILSTINYLPVAYANMIVAKIYSVKNVCIFTDTTSFFEMKENIEKMSKLKQILVPLYLKTIKLAEKNYDGYILFSKYMNKQVNIKNKPYVVMEGIFNGKNLNFNQEEKKNAIMYAGSLFEKYGIGLFLNAFRRLKDKDIQLWIFGGGEMVEEIKNISKEDNRIKYMGFRNREEVFQYQKQAKILINTRNSKDIYTKLSFPSKTFEYMVSGTPFLTTRIEGIPEEYYEYLYTIENESIEGVKIEMENILKKSEKDLYDFGEKARNFIMENKNARIQTEKVINFLMQVAKNNWKV